MSNTQASCNESNRSFHVARASIMFVTLLVMGYAVSTQVESAVATPAAHTVQASAVAELVPTSYFPAQYVNQGREAEEHIQAF